MRTYILISGAIFAVVALMHLLRLFFDWPAQIAGWAVPIWVSWIGVVAAGALCIWAFRVVSQGRAP